MSEAEIPARSSSDILLSNGDLYKLLIEENRHLHQVWIDNFRIIITFNSILLAGVFATITILGKGESLTSIAFAFAWFLRVVSLIGIVVTLVGVHIIRRTKAIIGLRNKEIRYLETNIGFGVPVFPFEEGAHVLGNSNKDSFFDDTRKPPYPIEILNINFFSGLGGYFLIGASFISAYILILLLSFLKIV